MPFGAVPWPDDMYRDATGHVALASLPGGVRASYGDALLAALAELDGFGVSSPVFFDFEGAIDAQGLPKDEAASMAADAAVFLMDADTASPNAFQRVPSIVHWSEPEHRLALRPALGEPLVPGRRYAAVVTRKLKAADGSRVDAVPAFVAVRDPNRMLQDPVLLAARAEYTPVLETLVKSGLPRESIVALAVFTVQHVDRDLADARVIVRTGKLQPATISDVLSGAELDQAFGTPPASTLGLDEALGAPHDQLLAAVQGTLPSNNLLSPMAKTHGAFVRDDAGRLRVKRTEDLPFTLFLPKPGAVPTGAATPVVIYQHALGRERSDAVLLANKLAAQGFATIAVDAPFHGLRAHAADLRNRFTGKPLPDGFGDGSDEFWGLSDKAGDLQPLHPFYARDALRQGAVDLMAVVRYLEQPDWSKFGSSDPVLKGLSFDATHIGLVGIDIGAQMGAMLATVEPAVATLALAFAGGGLSDGFWQSPANQALFSELATRLGRDLKTVDYKNDPPSFWPELAIVQTLLDRGDPLAHADALQHVPVNMLLLMAADDELVPNSATEAWASALGAVVLGGQPGYVTRLDSRPLASGQGVHGSFVIDTSVVTRALFPYPMAAHDTLLHVVGSAHYLHPLQPPWKVLPTDRPIENPLAAALTQVAQYLQAWYACASAKSAVTPAPTCDAVVRAP